MSRAPDVVVVGAGVVGSAAAYFLAGDGARVTLIERDAVGSHASGFAFGGIIPVESAPHGHVGPPGLGELAVRLHRELASVLPPESGVDTEYRLKPSITLAMRPAEVADLRRTFEAMKASQGGETRWFGTREELDAVEPRIGPAVMAALYAEGSAEVEPYRLTLALAQAAERRGARARHGAVSGLSFAGGRVEGVVAGGELVPASAVVIAAGPWSGAASEWAGVSLPVLPLKGQILRLRAPGPPLGALFWWGGDYATSKADGLVWAGTTEEHAGFDDAPTGQGRDRIMESAVSAFPYLADAQLVRQTACLRPISVDGAPVLGELPGRPGVVIATGGGRNGIMLGPAMGRVAADLVLGGAPSCDIRGLGPERFGT